MSEPAVSGQNRSVVDRAAEALRVLSLDSSEGTFLGSEDDMIAKLEQLGALHDKGILTDEEFAAQKAKILGG